MERETNLPFKVGDLVESRSFQIGFRGSWFRCKIREITKRQGRTAHILEYFDFPDEKLKCTRLYQVPPHNVGNVKAKRRELMLRPQYPPTYNEKQMRNASDISEVTVIVHNSWKVGDLVDWWTTGCYWVGKITELLGGDKAQIELNPPPLGEGASYEVSLKDCRPSLDWSPEHGWTLLTQEGRTGRPCARLINLLNQVSHSSNSTADSYKARSSETEKQSEGETVSNTEVNVGEEEKSTSCKSRRPCEGFALNSDRSDTLEAAVMDLEECVNKVKWLKRILLRGISSSAVERPQWKFVDSNSITEMNSEQPPIDTALQPPSPAACRPPHLAATRHPLEVGRRLPLQLEPLPPSASSCPSRYHDSFHRGPTIGEIGGRAGKDEGTIEGEYKSII